MPLRSKSTYTCPSQEGKYDPQRILQHLLHLALLGVEYPARLRIIIPSRGIASLCNQNIMGRGRRHPFLYAAAVAFLLPLSPDVALPPPAFFEKRPWRVSGRAGS